MSQAPTTPQSEESRVRDERARVAATIFAESTDLPKDSIGYDDAYAEAKQNFIAGFSAALKHSPTVLKMKEALEWYANGMPWRDDIGNQTQLAQAVLKLLDSNK